MNKFAALPFNDRDLYSVHFDGDDALDGFEKYITREIERRPLSLQRIQNILNSNRAAKLEIIREFMVECLQENKTTNVGQDEDTKEMIRRFVTMIGLKRMIKNEQQNSEKQFRTFSISPKNNIFVEKN